VGSLSYATSASVSAAIAALVDAAPSTLDTLNELAAALGDDPNFATTIATSIGGKLALTGGTLTGDLTMSGTNPRLYFTDTDNNPDYFISNTDGTFTVYDVTNSVGRFKIYTTGHAEFSNNLTAASFIKSGGTAAQFLKADGSVDGNTYLTGITSSQVTTALGYTPYNSTNPAGYITGITSANVTTALGYTPYNSTNPSGYITGISSSMVTSALGYTPYNSTNPSGYITASALSPYLLLSGGTMTGQIVGPSVNTGVYGGLIQIREQGYVSNGQSAWDYAPAITFHWGNRFATKVGCDSSGYLAIDNVRFLNASNYSSYAVPLSGGTLTGTLNFANGDGALQSATSGGVSFYQNEINAGAQGGTGSLYLGWRRTNQINIGAAISSSSTIYTTGIGSFGADGGSDTGIRINYNSSGYGRIRFYQDGSNHQTIHAFGSNGYSPSNGKINIDGQNGANIGSWNDPDFVVNKGAHTYARAYRGIGNVAGTGEASYHPAGMYSVGNQWLYGALYRNSANTYEQGQLYFNSNYGYGMVGLYSSTRYQAIFAMGDSYKLPVDGTTTGSLYGLAWSHPNAGGVAGNLNTHGLLVMENGTFLAAISGNIKARDGIVAGTYMYAPTYIESGGAVYGTIFYDNNDRTYFFDGDGQTRAYRMNLSNGQVQAANNAGGRLRISSWTNGESEINGNCHNIVLGPYTTRTGAGLYYAGIAINGLMNYGGTTTYDVAPHIWLGGYYRDTPGSERSDFVVAIKSGTGTSGTGADLPQVRFRVDYEGIATATGSFRSNDIYTTGGWFRNHTNNNGIYWSNTGWHIYPENANDIFLRSGTTNIGLRLTTSDAVARGYIYADTDNQVGILTNDRNWAFRITSNKTSYLHGSSLYVGYGNTSSNIFMADTDETQRRIHCNSNRIGFLNSSDGWGSYCNNDGSWVSTSDITAYSDMRVKENVHTISNALSTVTSLRGVSYNRIDDTSKTTKIGVIAQETQAVLPEVVQEQNDGMLSVSYGNFAGLFIEAFKEQQSQIESQQTEIAELKDLVKQLLAK
jgi:hypothetical protein